MKILQPDLIKIAIISLIMSVICSTICSTATYFITTNIITKQIPKFATVDLLGLSNDFLVNLSKYQFSKGASDEQVAQMVRNYSRKIQPLLDDISKSGNVILFQKQAIVTQTKDITPEIAQALFKDYLPDVGANGNNHINSNSNSNFNSKYTNQYASQYETEE